MDNKRPSLTLVALMFGPFLSMLDSGIVNVGLPAIATEFGVGLGEVQWVSSAYLAGIAVLLPFLGVLGDRVGRRRTYTLGYFVLAMFTLACGFAPNLAILIIFRALQALGAAMIIANGMALVTENSAPGKRGRNLGLLSTVGAIASITGPALGGFLIAGLGWRSVFPVTFIVALAGAISASWLLPHGEPNLDGSNNKGLKSLLRALLGVDLFGIARFRTSWLLSIMGFSALLTPTVLIPFYLQSVAGISPALAGMAMMSFPILMALVSPWSGKLSDKYGSELLGSLGLGVGTAALIGLAFTGSSSPVALTMALYGMIGFGMGLFQAPNNSSLMGAAPTHLLGSATAFTQLARNGGTGLGIAGAGLLFAALQGSASPGDPRAFFHSAKVIYLVAAGIVLVATIVSLKRRRAIAPV